MYGASKALTQSLNVKWASHFYDAAHTLRMPWRVLIYVRELVNKYNKYRRVKSYYEQHDYIRDKIRIHLCRIVFGC